MLSERRCAAMIPSKDLERAKRWYADKLGFQPDFEDESGVQYLCADGSEFWVYPSEYAGTNQATAMGWLSPDLSNEMDDLRSRGVSFEEYDIPGITTTGGIAEFPNGERAAWFTDSEGNILALYESPKYA